MRDRLWHRLLKRGGEYFMSARYAMHPRPLLLIVDGATDAEALRPLFVELQATYPSIYGGKNPDLHSIAAPSTPQRPPRVVLTGRGGLALTCSKAAVALGNAKEKRKNDATLCQLSSFASAWNLMAGSHFPREGTSRAGGSGGRDHVLMADLATGLAGTVETLKPLAIISVAGGGASAGPGGAGAGGAAIDEALAAVAEQDGVPLIRLPRKAGASGAALWLSRLSPEAFNAWHKVRVDILVLYDPISPPGEEGSGSHTEAQLQALLGSLAKADYLGDSVGLTVAIGSGRVPDSARGDALKWPHGRKTVRASIHPLPSTGRSFAGGGGIKSDSQGGGKDGGVADTAALSTLALRSWTPRDDDNFVVVLEAKHVVSRLFYSWLKVAVLETSYGGGGGQGNSGSPPRQGACVPGSNDNNGGSAWLFPASQWRAAQAQCIGGSTGGPKRCGRGGYYLRPTGTPICPPSRDRGEALVVRTGGDGAVETGGLMEGDKPFSDLVNRVFFSEKEKEKKVAMNV